MATQIKSAGRLVRTRQIQTQVTEISNVASNASRNVTKGPTIIFAIVGDNQKAAASNTRVHLKIYDKTGDDWAPGTTQAIMGFPIEAWTSPDDAQFIGTSAMWIIPDGLPIENGVSIAVAKEFGDDATTAPATAVQAELVHS